MKAHLIKSGEVNPELFAKVMKLLQAVPGVIKFSYDKESCSYTELLEESAEEKKVKNKRKVVSWSELFRTCNEYRTTHKIASDEFCLVLTDNPNERNFFTSLQDSMPYNGFVHTGDWDLFVDCPPEFPIAYVVISIMLLKYLNREEENKDFRFHSNPIGCISDFCANKNEIILKLRTADICRTCMNGLKKKLNMPALFHALDIMESLRVKMLYAQNFRQESKPSKLYITRDYRFFLPDFGNIEIILRPMEIALYVFFLKHPEGIYLSELENYTEDIWKIYLAVSHSNDEKEMRRCIVFLTKNMSPSASEKISRIRKIFKDAIGEDLSQHYIIRGDVGKQRKIAIERSLVILEGNEERIEQMVNRTM